MGVIRISCVGDLLPADTAYNLGTGIGSCMDRLISYYSVKENNPFLNSDIVFCNLEAPLILKSADVKLPFEGNPDVIQLLKILNISVVSIANNHVCDHGQEGFVQTSGLLKDNGFLMIGSNLENISEIGRMQCMNKKLAFAAFNDVKDHPECRLVAPLERGILFNTLERIKKQSPDFIIFSLHWGDEYITWPSLSQTDLAHELIDNGVNIIIGHHPHVVQPVERYHGGIILYSLGNFLFDMQWSETVRNGMQIDLILNEDNTIDYQVKPYRINSDFTQDYTSTKEVLSILSKAGKTFEQHKVGSRVNYKNIYTEECKKRRLKTRLRMKWYLITNVFRLSPQSRSMLFRNIKTKSFFLWKKN
jgi:gamma-polyglutamate biosynthesis protein CapA